MNTDPSPTPNPIPVGKLEPSTSARKASTAAVAPVLMSRAYAPPPVEEPSAITAVLPAPAETLPSPAEPFAPATDLQAYVIPPAPAVDPLLNPWPQAARSSAKTWALVAMLAGVICVGSGVAYALVFGGINGSVEIANGPGEPIPLPGLTDKDSPKGNDPIKGGPGDGQPKGNVPVEVKPPADKVDDPAGRGGDPVVVREPPPEFRPVPPAWKPVAKIPGLEPKDIDEAIKLGVAHLKKTQQLNGTWHNGPHQIGYAALPGLTLLECGVPAKDPAVKSAAGFVRNNVANLNGTYELALAVLFLDRLGDPKDKGVIQMMSLRLVAGQYDNGGWPYHCPVLTAAEAQPLLTFLQANRPPRFLNPLVKPPGEFVNPLGKNDPALLNPLDRNGQPLLNALVKPTELLPNPLAKPDQLRLLNPLAKPNDPLLPNPLRKPGDPGPKGPDPEKKLISPLSPAGNAPNPGASKTAPFNPADSGATKPAPVNPLRSDEVKPVAPPKLKPKGPILPKNVNRPDFLPPNLKDLAIVNAIGKGKGKGGAERFGRDDNSNSQFAMLALWAARRHDVPTEQTLQLAQKRYQQGQHNDGGWGYVPRSGSTPAMTCVGLLGLAMGHGVTWEAPDRAKPPQADPAIQNGLQALGRSIGKPLDVGQPSMENLYFLWSVERVAMLYNLPTISGKDWYGWGAQLLVKNQLPNGSWHGGKYHGSAPLTDTCFALLFLKRSNLVHDLTVDLPRFVTVIESEKARK